MYHFRLEVAVQEMFKLCQDIPVGVASGNKLAIIESHAVIKQKLDIVCNECFTMFINGLAQLMIHISVPSAVDAGDNKVLVAGGYENGVVMLKIEKKTDGSYGATVLFTHNDFGEHTKPPILYNGYFYGQFSTNSKRDGLACMDMDGKVLWRTMREPLFDKGSMILADGVLLATDGAKNLYIIEPSPAGFKSLAKAELFSTPQPAENNQAPAPRMGAMAQNWGPMALAGGKLLIRDQTKLMCIKVVK